MHQRSGSAWEIERRKEDRLENRRRRKMILIYSVLLWISLFLAFIFFFQTGKKEQNFSYRSIEKMLDERIHEINEQQKQKRYVDLVTKRKKNVFVRFQENLYEKLYSEYSNFTMLGYVLMVAFFLFLGFLITKDLRNPIFTILVMFTVSFLPYLIVSYITSRRMNIQNKKLLLVMGNLATAVLRTQTFTEAVEQSMDIIPGGIQEKFMQYYRSVLYLNTKPEDAMAVLRDSINNSYFHKFMNLAISAELGEKNLKYTLQSIPMDYKRYLDINEENARKVKDENIAFSMVLCSFPLVIWFIKSTSDYYYQILINTAVGKLTLIIVFLLLLGASMLFIRLNKPVKLKL